MTMVRWYTNLITSSKARIRNFNQSRLLNTRQFDLHMKQKQKPTCIFMHFEPDNFISIWSRNKDHLAYLFILNQTISSPHKQKQRPTCIFVHFVITVSLLHYLAFLQKLNCSSYNFNKLIYFFYWITNVGQYTDLITILLINY